MKRRACNRARLLAMAFASCLIMAGSSRIAHAQELHGTITRADGQPANSVIVLMLDSLADSVVARVVSSERGYFSLKAPHAMYVRLQLLRLGQHPATVGGFALAQNDSKEVSYRLANDPILMTTIDVKKENRCQVRAASSGALVQAMDEALKALMASASSVSSTTNTASFTRFDRQEDVRGRLVKPESRVTSTGPTIRPFRSIDAGTLARTGYVTADARADSSTYWAPDAEVLFSETFLAHHCLQITTGRSSRPALIGIEFHPVDRKKELVDLKGTIWMDSASRELRSVEYAYEGLSRDFGNSGAGGKVEFTRTADGLWFVNQWVIRMPRATIRKKNGPSLPGSGIEMEAVLDGMKVTGGFVENVRSNGDLVYQRGATTIADAAPATGVASQALAADKQSGAAPIAAASPPPALAAAPPQIPVDTQFVRMRCDITQQPDFAGVILGRVVNGDKIGISGASVVAEWSDDPASVGGAPPRGTLYQITVASVLDGSYQFCGVPLNRVVQLHASLPSRRSPIQPVKISRPARRAEIDLQVGPSSTLH